MFKLLLGHDESVAVWAFHHFRRIPTPYRLAIGVLNEQNLMVGAVLFQEYNGFNAELSYFGPKTMTLGMVRSLATIAVRELNVLRLTVRVPRRAKRLQRGVRKIGFVYEGLMPCFYGSAKGDAAVILGMYRDKLERLMR